MSLRKKAINGVAFLGFSAALVHGLAWVQMALLVRFLQPAHFGLVDMAGVVLGLVGIVADLSLGNAVIHRRDATREALSSVYWFQAGLGFAFAAALWTGAPLIAKWYREPLLEPVMRWSSAQLFVSAAFSQFQSLMEKRLEFGFITAIETVGSVTGMAVSVLSAWKGNGALSLVWGSMAGSAVRGGLVALKSWPHWRPSLHFDLSEVGGYARFGTYHAGQRLVNYVTRNIDQVLIGSRLGAADLGHYGFAFRNADVPSTHVLSVITRVFFPVLSQVADDDVRFRSVFMRMLRVSAMINVPLVALMACAAPLGIPLILGPGWARSVLLLEVLCVVGLIRGLTGTIGPVILARGRTDLGFRLTLAIMLIQVPALWAGVRMGGAMGVALMYAGFQCLYAVLYYVVFFRSLIGPCLGELAANIWPAFLAGAATAAAMGAALLATPGWPAAGRLAVELGAGLTAYAACLLAWHRDLLAEIAGAMGRSVQAPEEKGGKA